MQNVDTMLVGTVFLGVALVLFQIVSENINKSKKVTLSDYKRLLVFASLAVVIGWLFVAFLAHHFNWQSDLLRISGPVVEGPADIPTDPNGGNDEDDIDNGGTEGLPPTPPQNKPPVINRKVVNKEDLSNYPTDQYLVEEEIQYRYRTSARSETESYSSTMNGWVLVSTKTENYVGEWQKEVVSGNYNIGYYYDCWGWNYNGDITYYVGRTKEHVMEYVLQRFNYTRTQVEKNVNYFWIIHTKDYGETVKMTVSVNQEGAGKTTINNTMMYFTGKRYQPTTRIIYVYEQWSDWSGWSNWSRNAAPKSSKNENIQVEKKTIYYVSSR